MQKNGKEPLNARWALGAGIIAAIASAACCILPLILFLFGISGAWIGNLTAMEPYRPYFLTVAAITVLFGYWKIYLKKKVNSCERDSYCSMPKSDLINKIMLWISSVIIILVLLYPYIAPVVLNYL